MQDEATSIRTAICIADPYGIISCRQIAKGESVYTALLHLPGTRATQLEVALPGTTADDHPGAPVASTHGAGLVDDGANRFKRGWFCDAHTCRIAAELGIRHDQLEGATRQTRRPWIAVNTIVAPIIIEWSKATSDAALNTALTGPCAQIIGWR